MKGKVKTAQLNQLHRLERRIAVLRHQHKVSARGEILFQAPRSMWSSADVVVEADGEGAARLLIVEGNYPADYITHKEQFFQTEDKACEVADEIVEQTRSGLGSTR